MVCFTSCGSQGLPVYTVGARGWHPDRGLSLGTGLARTGTNTGTPREPPKRLLRPRAARHLAPCTRPPPPQASSFTTVYLCLVLWPLLRDVDSSIAKLVVGLLVPSLLARRRGLASHVEGETDPETALHRKTHRPGLHSHVIPHGDGVD